MFAALVSVALVILPAINGVLAQFSVDTPTFVQCEVANVSWTQSDGPYTLLVVPADDECGDAIDELDDLSGLSTSYFVNFAAGFEVVLYLEDSEGNDAWSSNITVQSGSNSSCLNSTDVSGSANTSSWFSSASSSAASSSSSVSATLSSVEAQATPPPSDVGNTPSSGSSSSSDDGGVVNSGSGSSSSASSAQTFSATLMFGSAVAAIFVFYL